MAKLEIFRSITVYTQRIIFLIISNYKLISYISNIIDSEYNTYLFILFLKINSQISNLIWSHKPFYRLLKIYNLRACVTNWFRRFMYHEYKTFHINSFINSIYAANCRIYSAMSNSGRVKSAFNNAQRSGKWHAILDYRDYYSHFWTMLGLEGEPRGLKTAVIQSNSLTSRYSHAKFMVVQCHVLKTKSFPGAAALTLYIESVNCFAAA